MKSLAVVIGVLMAFSSPAALKELPGHLPAQARAAALVSGVPADQTLGLSLGLPLRDPAGAAALLAQITDPKSDQFRHYLTPAEFTAKFAPTEAQYNAVVAFAKKSGFTIASTHPNRMVVDVTGSAATVEKAFQVRLSTFKHPTEPRNFFAPDKNPLIDSVVPIQEIHGLSDYYKPKPAGLHLNPAVTAMGGSGPGGTYMGNDFRKAYAPDVAWTGANQVIALVEFDGYNASDITTYYSRAGITAVPLQNVLVGGYSGAAGNNNIEVCLDIEVAAAMAPGLSKIMVYESSGVISMLSQIANDNAARQISCSWGWGTQSATEDQIFQQMALQGQSFFTASGDSGAYVGAISAPSDNPYVTVVGGTTLTTAAGGAWSSETTWNAGGTTNSITGSSGGISTVYSIPSWQLLVNTAQNGGSTTMRNIPDIALTADNIYATYNNGAAGGVGGTSAATPLWAAFNALINQQLAAASKSPVGFINPQVYALASTNNTALHDITTGNNLRFNAGAGYDLCTGLGTPVGQITINLLAGVQAPVLSPPTLSLSTGTVTMMEDDVYNFSFVVTDSKNSVVVVTNYAYSSNTGLVSNATLVFSGSGTNRTLALRPGLHKSGSATITLAVTDPVQPASTNTTFTLTVTPTNYPPVFSSMIANLIRNENAGATNLAFVVSDTETPAGSLTITATSTNTALVPNANLVLSGSGTNRTLTVTPLTNQAGTTLIEVVVTDQAVTGAGGPKSATNDFLLTVNFVNQPPTFNLATNKLFFTENFGAVSNYQFVSNITSGPANQSSESNYFVLSYTTNFFAQAPAVDANGSLTFQVGTNLWGTNTITFVLNNTGPTTNGGRTSLTNVLTLNVAFVNFAPSNTLSTNLILALEETAGVTNTGFVSSFNVGSTNESGQTWAFTVSAVTNNATNVIFATLPAIATNGTLTFKPAAHSYGTNLITVVMKDNGGTLNGGVDSYTNTFTIGVMQTNHAPVIVVTNASVLENATNIVGTNNLTVAVNVWSYDLKGSNFVVTATSLNTNLATVGVTLTNAVTVSNSVYTLTFALVTNTYGTVTNQIVATEGALSTTNYFTLTVGAVNHAPVYTFNTNNLQVLEESGIITNANFLTALSTGPASESWQTWTFTVSAVTNNATNVIFLTAPVIATNGTLMFRPAAHSYGTNLVTVVMKDTGGTGNGGVDSYTNTFTIGVVQTNHAPSIVLTNYTMLENGTNIVGTNNLTVAVNVWSYDALGSNFVVTATSLNTNLATVGVALTNAVTVSNSVYTLMFALVTNTYGTVTNQIVATEGALSTTNYFTLTVGAVDHAPSFVFATNQLLALEESGAATNAGFLTGLSTGPASEGWQTWTFTVSAVTNNATNVIFATLPTIATNGTLIFKPAAHSYGTNLVTVVMKDNGSTNNGGTDSYTNTFTIGVIQTNHAPAIVVTNYSMLENGTNIVGTNNLTVAVNVWSYDALGSNFVVTATSLNTNLATVGVTLTNVASVSNSVYTLTFALVTNTYGTVTNQIVATEGALSTTNTFTLTVGGVNHAPGYSFSTNNVQVLQESGIVTNAGFLTGLSTGPASESWQTWTFTVTTMTNQPTNAIFLTVPVIATNGTLIFRPMAHSYGTNLITVVMKDNGGTNNGGTDSYTNTFTIGVQQTNHTPVIVLTNYSMLENGTNIVGTNNLTVPINVWSYDALGSNFVVTATSLNTNLATVGVTLTNAVTVSNSVYTLTFALVTNMYGTVTNQIVATEGALSTTNYFTLAVGAVNHAPSFSFSTNQVFALEESAATTNANYLTTFGTGPASESWQTWTFTVTAVTNNATNVIFATLPTIATNGTLVFKPAAHSYGTNLVTVVMKDTGSTNNGGVDSFTNTFTIGVIQTNHAPAIVVTNASVLENGTNLVGTNNLTVAVNVWSYDALGSNFVVTATSLNTNLATVGVTLTNVASVSNSVYTLTFALVTNTYGTVTNQIVATEGALSTTNYFTLTVGAVNHAPSFSFSTNQIFALEESAATTNAAYLTGFSTGPASESWQTWTFTVSAVTNNATNVIFATLPTIATNGTLVFKPAAHSYGTNLVTVVMKDNGGTNNAGVDSYTNTFTIGVMQTNHAPAIVVTNASVLENGTNIIGTNNLTVAVNVWSYDLKGSNFVVTATSLNTNLATVAITLTNAASVSNSVYTLTFALVTNVYGKVTNQIVATEGALSTTNYFTLTVGAVNHAPSYGVNTNLLLVLEESSAVTMPAYLTNLSVGPASESGQTWTFTATTVTNNPTNVVFTVLPTIGTNGTLQFLAKPHSYGTNLVTVVMKDNGGTNNGGTDSYTNTFTIGVIQTNHAPAIVVTNASVLENGTNIVGTNNLTVAVNVWSYDALGSNFVVTATSLNTNLATVGITLTNAASVSNSVYTLTFVLGTNMYGTVTNQIVATEGALSTTNYFTLTVGAVNHAPSFSFSTNQVFALEESAASTNASYLTSLSTGPASESWQTWTFTVSAVTNNATNVIFATLPTIATNGTLVFKPALHSYGTNLVTVVMKDNGGTNNAGTDSYTNTFTIGVAQTNHAPVIVVTNASVLENGTNIVGTNNLTVAVNVWSFDPKGSNFVVTATSLNTNLATVGVTLTNEVTVSNSVYTLTFALVTNVYGTVTNQIVATEGALSTTNTFILTMGMVNHAPAYTLSTNTLVVPENAGLVSFTNFLTGMSAGPASESSQTWSFTVYSTTNVGGVTTNATFAQWPAVLSNGTLSFKPASYSFGTNLITVVMKDSGGTTNGGVDSYTNTFRLQVTQVPYPPAFTGITNKTIYENGTNGSLAFSLFDPLTNGFTVSCVSSNTNVVTVSISGTTTNRTIVLTPVTNMFGSNITISVTADDGTLTNSTNFTVTVVPVNQAPSFALAVPSITVTQFNLAVSYASVVTNIHSGPTNESWQSVSFTLTNNARAGVFLAAPALDTNGTLTFTPGAQTAGQTVTVGIKAVDNGGTNYGGANASAVQTLTIVVPNDPYNALAGAYAGLFYDTNGVANASSGYFKLQVTNDATFGGYLLCAGASNAFSGAFNLTNGLASVSVSAYRLSLAMDIQNYSGTVSGLVSNTAPWNAQLQSFAIDTAPIDAGTYVLALPGFNSAAAGPAGSSYFSLFVSNSGACYLNGAMADNTDAIQLTQISTAAYIPVYVPLYNGGAAGSLIGWMQLTGNDVSCVSNNSTMTWINEAGATALYPGGFTNQTVMTGASYGANPGAVLTPFSAGTVVLSGGNLATSITNTVSIAGNLIRVDPLATNGLHLTISAGTGEVLGTFVAGGHTNAIYSGILQGNTNVATGFFLGTSQGGSFNLKGN